MNPLTDLIPAKYRKYVYGLAAVAAFLYSIFEAVDGDWKAFVPAAAAALLTALAHANVDVSDSTHL